MPPEANEEDSNVTDMDKLYKLYVDNFPLTYVVTDKLSEDHQLAAANISKQTSVEAAIERYRRNQNILLSSWFLMSEETLLNKAKGAEKKARTFRGGQQLAAKIKVNRRTVTLRVLTRNESRNTEFKEVDIGGEKRFIGSSSEEKTLDILIIGPWDPLTGEFQLYHYEEAALPLNHEMLPKYSNWWRDKKTKTYIRPVAKK